jgi:serine/threonine-protein kinase
VLKFRTLGGVFVADSSGEPLTGAATQRRLLALLAALAVAGDAGLSRDKLVALLWPDADEERARHSLTQALYAARRAVAVDDLFVVGGDVRLNRDRITSDVQEFAAALDSGELERAVELYRGPFLDGFFLGGSAEFEQWTTVQRARIEDRAAEALDRLAREAEEAASPQGALGWRKRLAALRPLDSAVAAALMRSYAQAGDRAGALQHARLHETLLREQLGLGADPVVAALAVELREPVPWQPEPPAPWGVGSVAPVDPPSVDPRSMDTASTAAATEEALATGTRVDPPTPGGAALVRASEVRGEPVRVVPPRARTVDRRLWITAAVAALVLALVLVLGRDRPDAAPPVASLRLDQKVVVAPFRVAGASAPLAYLRDGIVELLSARLADDSGARSVDPGAVLGAWRAAGLSAAAEVPRETVVRLAERLGAERVVVGSVVGDVRRVVVSAAVVQVPSGVVAGEATVEGPADSVSALVDRLAARLLVLGAGEEETLSSQTTGSLSALRAFLDGQSAFRSGRYAVALRRYEQALDRDSTFALAGLQLARTADRAYAAQPRARGLAAAWRGRSALDERGRALLLALAGPRYPAPSTAEEQIAAWERVVDLTPDNAASWYELALRLFRDGPTARLHAPGRADTALRRALELDPGHAPARELLAQSRLMQSLLAMSDSAARAAGPDTGLPLTPFLQWRAAVARGDVATLRRVRDSMALLGPANLRSIAQAAQLDAVALDDAHRAVRQLRARALRPEERVDATLAEHALAVNEGRVREARAAAERLAELQPGARAHLRLRVLDALYGDADSVAADAAAELLRRSATTAPSPEPARRAVQLADACVLAQWQLARGDTAGARRSALTLRDAPASAPVDRLPAATTPAACSALLDAAGAVAEGRADAAAAVARVDSLALTTGTSGDAPTYAPVLVARLHARLGDARAAYDAVRRRAYMAGWTPYEATALRDEARYAAQAGLREPAHAALTRFAALRADPDAALQGQTDEARRTLAAPVQAPPP